VSLLLLGLGATGYRGYKVEPPVCQTPANVLAFWFLGEIHDPYYQDF